MVRLIPALFTLFSAAAVSAAPFLPNTTVTSEPVVAACAYTCGSVCYDNSQVSAALNKGYSLHRSGDDINNYPHRYNNYEGFDFPTPGPWFEYPILSSGNVYQGGSPGPDRIIFDDDGVLNGLITHTGASGNGFVECQS